MRMNRYGARVIHGQHGNRTTHGKDGDGTIHGAHGKRTGHSGSASIGVVAIGPTILNHQIIKKTTERRNLARSFSLLPHLITIGDAGGNMHRSSFESPVFRLMFLH